MGSSLCLLAHYRVPQQNSNPLGGTKGPSTKNCRRALGSMAVLLHRKLVLQMTEAVLRQTPLARLALLMVLACAQGCASAPMGAPEWVPGTYDFLVRTYADDLGVLRGTVEVDAEGPRSVTTDKVRCVRRLPATRPGTRFRHAVFDCSFDVTIDFVRNDRRPISGYLYWGQGVSRGEPKSLQWVSNDGLGAPGGA